MFASTQIMIILCNFFYHEFDWLNAAATVTAITKWLQWQVITRDVDTVVGTCFLLLPQAHQKYCLFSSSLTLYGSLAIITTSVLVQ